MTGGSMNDRHGRLRVVPFEPEADTMKEAGRRRAGGHRPYDELLRLIDERAGALGADTHVGSTEVA